MSDAPADAPVPAPPAAREDALAVVNRLREAGHAAYFAGGCVRDMLLGLTPTDFDIATDATPERVRRLFSHTQAVGAAFGVILVRHRRSQVEVATFRTDLKYTDGRRPEGVVFTTAEEDARRRDFTINGMFFDPIEEKVIDYVGGQEDLNNKLLRAIGEPEHRFEEDHLRMLRAVRFAARFGLQIESATAAAIASHATHLARISPERVAEELRLMLTATTRATAAQLAREFGLDDVIFRFTPAPRLRAQRPMVMFDRVEPGTRISFGFALAAASIEYRVQRMPHLSEWPAMIREFNIRGMVQGLRQSLRISNEEADEMEETLYGLNFLLTEEKPAVAALKRFLARPTAPLSRKLLAALSVENARELDDRLRALEQTDIAPQPLITGDDLTAAGLAPGPVFKRVLDAVYDAQLEDRIASKDQAMELAMRLARC